MAVSLSENRRMKQKVEVLARACRQYEQLVEKLRKTASLAAKFDILYDMGKYQMVIDGQDTLDEAIKHNGKKLVVEFLLQNGEEERIEVKKPKKVSNVVDWDANYLMGELPDQIQRKTSNAGTLYGKSYGLPSEASRYSEKLHKMPGRYTIGRPIGEGTLGKVYVAEGKKGGTYAVKIIPKNGKHLPREADVDYLRKLRHERIVEYMYIIEPSTSNDIHILMEYMHSGSLKQYIESFAPLHHELVMAYTKQILEGLDFLHRSNIIHQDLKPANLLLKNNHRERLIKIADFGSSRFSNLKKSQPGSQGRTPKYTDPAVSLGKEIAGKRSDIWSLGVIVIEMYTGKYPWNIEGEHPITVPRILEENEPKIEILNHEKISDDVVGMAKMMLLPVHQRPYADALLELPVLQESAQSTEDSDSDDDYF